jgi:hypothetical protein
LNRQAHAAAIGRLTEEQERVLRDVGLNGPLPAAAHWWDRAKQVGRFVDEQRRLPAWSDSPVLHQWLVNQQSRWRKGRLDQGQSHWMATTLGAVASGR